MASQVFFTPVDGAGQVAPGAIRRIFDAAGLAGCFRPRDMVALKLHFGETGSRNIWRPQQAREVVMAVRERGGLPFLTDANVLYKSKRHNAVEHLEVAAANGFSFETAGAPLIIADGLRGDNSVELPIPGGRHYSRARIAAEIARADAIISLTHVTGHMLFGLGAAIKNLAMGSGSAAGKQMMHALYRPSVDEAKCTACGACARHCPTAAFSVPKGSKARLDASRCIGCGECAAHCPSGAIPINWGDSRGLQERTVEFAAAMLAAKPGRHGFISLLTSVTPNCDCMRDPGKPFVPDIGILASMDPVAIDQASLDLVQRASASPGAMRLADAAPGTEIGVANELAERMGLGSRQYELVEV
ncbi:MAG TPA: DUF362 domain-containing protein [Planctomycetota bacterium]|nr:DUF362 domain-containing protein [Planctomycetota bacterium]